MGIFFIKYFHKILERFTRHLCRFPSTIKGAYPDSSFLIGKLGFRSLEPCFQLIGVIIMTLNSPINKPRLQYRQSLNTGRVERIRSSLKDLTADDKWPLAKAPVAGQICPKCNGSMKVVTHDNRVLHCYWCTNGHGMITISDMASYERRLRLGLHIDYRRTVGF